MAYPTRAIIDLAELKRNLDIIRGKIGGRRHILAVVKANAYGHGALRLAAFLEKQDIRMLGVAYVEEGIVLRDAGIKAPILVMGGVLPGEMQTALATGLTLTISDIETALALSRLASGLKVEVRVHVKVDTGMGRLGFEYDKAKDSLITILKLPNLKVEGIFTHLATAEEPDPSYTLFQIKRFQKLTDSLINQGIKIPVLHIANSAAVLQHSMTYMDMVRVGIMIYGVAPSPELQDILPIRPILSLKTKIIHIKHVAKGTSISYGCTYICPSDRLIAIIPIGYSDGFARSMSGKAHVLIRGNKAPVLGTICMDMSIVDISDVPGIRTGDEALLLGSEGNESITALDWASWQNTIPYEVLCSIGHRISREYINEPQGA